MTASAPRTAERRSRTAGRPWASPTAQTPPSCCASAPAGPDMAIRLDANGAWTVAEALTALRALEPAGIELCEEPVHGADQIAELSPQTGVPLAMDESAAGPGALDRRVCAAVGLKISR